MSKTLIGNGLFEILDLAEHTIGFAACEAEADQKIYEHAVAAGKAFFLEQCCRGLAPSMTSLVAWYEKQRTGYKIVRIG